MKWDRNECLNIIKDNKEKKFSDYNFNNVKNISLKLDLLRFKEVLLWYDENVLEKYMGISDIFTNSLLQGPAFAAELSDTLKYSIRNTLEMRYEKIIESDYPEIRSSINYIFDPKCLLNWEIPDDKDYLFLFKERKEIDQQLLETIVENIPLPDLRVPDIYDSLKLFRKSKCFRDDILKSEDCYKVFSKKKKFDKISSLRFKRSVAYKYPDEQRDILVCNPDTLKLILDCQFYLSQILNKCDNYQKDRTKVYNFLKNNKNKYVFIMTDLKKCGLTFPRKAAIFILKYLYSKYHLECFETLANGLDSYLLYIDGKWELTEEGLGLGMLNELVTLYMCLIWTEYKGEFPKDSNAWFFGDDQVIMIPKKDFQKSDFDFLNFWNNILKSFGLDVHMNKPWMSNICQFCEIYSPCNIDFEKSLRQFNIICTPIYYDIVEAKSIFSNNYLRWWGLKQSDYEKALSFLLQHHGYEFNQDEVDYPFELGGWFKQKNDNNKFLNPLLINVISNWKQLDKRFLNLLNDNQNIYKSSKWYKKYLKKNIEIPFKAKFKDKTMYSLDTRFKQLQEAILLPTTKKTQINFMKIKERIKFRTKLFNSKPMTLEGFYNHIKSKTWNNYCIPSEFAIESDELDPIDIVPLSNFTESKEISRLYNIFIEEEIYINPPEKGDLTTLWGALIEGTINIKDEQIKHCSHFYYQCLPYLVHFGNNTKDLYDDLCNRVNSLNISELTFKIENLFDKFPIEDLSVTNKFTYICDYGIIFKIDNINIPFFEKILKNGYDCKEIRFQTIMNSFSKKYDYEQFIFLESLDYRKKIIESIFNNTDKITPEIEFSIPEEIIKIEDSDVFNDKDRLEMVKNYIQSMAYGVAIQQEHTNMDDLTFNRLKHEMNLEDYGGNVEIGFDLFNEDIP